MKSFSFVCLMLVLRLGSTVAYGQDTSTQRRLLTSAEFFFRKDVIQSVTPDYPSEAKKDGIQGEVKIYALFDKNGVFEKAKIVSSPHQLLSEAVLKAVREWRYRPIDKFDPESIYLGELRFIFRLTDGQAEVIDAPEEEQRKPFGKLTEQLKRYFRSASEDDSAAQDN